jgi:hypothetical protein
MLSSDLRPMMQQGLGGGVKAITPKKRLIRFKRSLPRKLSITGNVETKIRRLWSVNNPGCTSYYEVKLGR